ncbi:MAG: MauE/DoxX family redox-associated membrane protein [Desulfobacterales bacterium]
MKNKLTQALENSWLELAVRWFIGALFVFASYHKILDPAHFAKIVYGYYLFPDVSINLIAIILPPVELFAGLALILGIYPRSASLIINLMLFGFIIAIGLNLIRGQQFDCGCFSFDEQGYGSSAGGLLLRDILYFVLGLHLLFFKKMRRLSLLQTGSILKNVGA